MGRAEDERASEELYLDFKQISTKSGERKLSDSDSKNLAKAVSGFGNSVGGIVIWGVDCRPDSDGADIPGKKLPADDAAQIRSLIEGRVSGVTIPSHGGVRSIVVPAGGDARRGFVVSLIPAADNMPLQVPAQACYYMRSGSDFVRIIHPVLAAMFGRRPQPIVEIEIEIFKEANHADRPDLRMIVACHAVIRNRGAGIAEGMYATVELKTPEYCDHSWVAPTTRTLNRRAHLAR